MHQIADFFTKLFNSSDWPPRWHCGQWTAFHGWLYIISDLLIWSAYFAIPIVIIRYASRKKNIRFTKLYFLFAAFILACGATHFLDALAFWIPLYRLSALFRFITGVVSWATVFYLVKYLPVIFSLKPQATLEAEIEERKKTEQALRKSRKDYELLIGGVKDYAIFMLDPQGRVASWNSGAKNIKGYKAEEIIGQPMDVFYTPEQLAIGEPLEDLRQASLNGKFETQGWRVKKDGSLFWADVVFTTLYDEEHRFYGYAKITRDITEKRKAEEQLALLATIASNIQDPVISTDNDGIINRWNKGAELLLEWKAEEVVGKEGTGILKIDYLQTTRELVTESFKEKSYWQGEVVYHTKMGRPLNVLVTVSQLLDADGKSTGNLAVVRDITERKKAVDKLKEFEYFFNNSNDLSGIANTEGYFEILSPSFNSVLGYTNDELSKIPFIDFVHPDDMAVTHEAYNQLKAGASVIHFINRYRKKNGDYLWLDWNATPNATTGKLYCIARDITARKKAEDAVNQLNEELEQKIKERTVKLAASEMRFRMLIENSTDGIDLSDEFSNNIYRSPGAVKITGMLPKENQMGFTHPDDVEIIQHKQEELLKNPGVPIPFQARFRHALGYYLWLEGTFTNLLHVEGVHAFITNFRDITERKKLEVLLQKANSLARIGGWEIDLVKGTVFWSDITREIHETDYDFIPDLENGINFYKEGPGRDLITQRVTEAIELGKPWDVELQIVTAKNNERWVRSIGETEFANGKCIRVYGSFQDIDERKKSEIELERLNERLHLAMQSAQLGLWDWDVKNNVLVWDEGMYRLYNIGENEFTSVYDGWSSRVHPEDRQRADDAIQEALAGKKDYDPEFRIVWKDSSVHYIKASAFIERDSNGNMLRMTGFNWDITKQKKAEDKIRNINIELEQKVATRTEQLKKTNEELESFSYSVSHDLRAPLRSIIGFTTILEEEYLGKLDAEAQRITGIIKSNTSKMGSLIDDLLSFSRLGRQQIIKTSLHTDLIVKDIVAEIMVKNSDKQVQWIVNSLPDAAAHATSIRQVWVNLLSNAVKYSNKKEQPVIEIGSITGEDEVIFFVKDNGIGFDEAYSDKLFKVFQRLHGADFEGTGVGLAIVERIISRHGGKVWAHGEQGKGACFFFSLPKSKIME